MLDESDRVLRVRRLTLVGPIALAAIALIAFAVLVAGGFGGGRTIRVGDDVGTVIAAAFAAFTCWLAARAHGGRNRLFWSLLAAAALAWTFGELIWGVYDLAAHAATPGITSPADVGYLSAVLLAFLALLAHPGNRADGATRGREVLDGVILAVALLFLGWTFVLREVWAAGRLGSGAGVVSLAYPVGDVVIVYLVIRAMRLLRGRDRIATAWILFGLLAISLSDSGYTYLTVVHHYETGSLLDIGWVAGYLGLALAGWYGRQSTGVVRHRPSVSEPAIGLLAPFLPILLALGVVTFRAETAGQIDRPSLVLAFVLTGSVVLRQALVVVGRASDGMPNLPQAGDAS